MHAACMQVHGCYHSDKVRYVITAFARPMDIHGWPQNISSLKFEHIFRSNIHHGSQNCDLPQFRAIC